MSVSIESWKTCPNPFNEKNENVCTICFSSDPTQTVSHAPKNSSKAEHVFHKTCIKTWVDSGEENNKCPLCREEVSPGNTKGKYQDLADNFDRWNSSERTKLDLAVAGVAAAGVAALAAAGAAAGVAGSLGLLELAGGEELAAAEGLAAAVAAGMIGLAAVADSHSLRPMLQNRGLGRIELFTGTVAVAAVAGAAVAVGVVGAAGVVVAAGEAAESTKGAVALVSIAAAAGAAAAVAVITGAAAAAVITGEASVAVAAEGARWIKGCLLSVLRR